MRAAFTFILVGQHDLDLGLPRFLAQVVMPYQAIKVEWRSDTDVALQRLDFRHLLERLHQPVGQVGCTWQCRALRHVDDDTELRLVIERQHLHRDRAEIKHRYGCEKHHHETQQERPRGGAMIQQRGDDRTVESSHGFLDARFLLLGTLQLAQWRPEAPGEPGREHEGGNQRKHHRHRADQRDREHVGTHHARDETHRQQGRQYRERCDDRRVTDLAHGIHCGGYRDILVSQPSPKDILGNDGGIVDQDADGEYQREQADPVDAETEHPGRPYRHQHNHGYHDDDDHRGAQPDRDQAQHTDGDRGFQQRHQQLVDLVGRGLAIVAADHHVDIRRNQNTLQGIDPPEQPLSDNHAVGTAFLGDRYRDGIRTSRNTGITGESRPRVNRYHVLGLGRTFADFCQVANVDRGTVVRPHEQVLDVCCGTQECPGRDLEVMALELEVADALPGIRTTNRRSELIEADAIALQPFRQHPDLDLVLCTTDNETAARVRGFLEALQDLKREFAQVYVIDNLRPQGQRDDRDIIDTFRLYQRM